MQQTRLALPHRDGSSWALCGLSLLPITQFSLIIARKFVRFRNGALDRRRVRLRTVRAPITGILYALIWVPLSERQAWAVAAAGGRTLQ